MTSILPFVEGVSEISSVPVLLRRPLAERSVSGVAIARPFRVSRYGVVRPGELEKAIEMGLRTRSEVAALLVLLDADDDDPSTLEKELLARARRIAALPSRVVVATREYEAWLLGAKESLRGNRGIHPDAVAPPSPETIRGAKEELNRNFAAGSYLEVDDQVALTAKIDLDLAAERCPSFTRMRTAVEELVSTL